MPMPRALAGLRYKLRTPAKLASATSPHSLKTASRHARRAILTSPRRRWALGTVLAIVAIKLVFLLADARPAYFLGDSESYLATATIKYIPTSRSFLYGFFIRRIA